MSLAVLAAWCARAGLDATTPSRDHVRYDCIVADTGLSWVLPVMVKGVARDGMSVARKNADFPGVIAWVFLGRHDGGLDSRRETTIVVMDARTAWSLPTRLGLQIGDDDPSYRWPSITQALRDELTDKTAATPQDLRLLFEKHGWQPDDADRPKSFEPVRDT
ncbi:hypothetical protein ACIBG0_36890 [Nocardia sp. NPDC050630]|uniref:hypothetical protein n=1 Tax=Nocardia sp. NPDC050630 TaxID=3364321 RepID=UPI0037A96882